ncbi:MAG: hypothetical protein Q8L78_09340 [Coxiellaceae bacterium]|nr:hypothetical protein [Coxiellaceae bacterium]
MRKLTLFQLKPTLSTITSIAAQRCFNNTIPDSKTARSSLIKVTLKDRSLTQTHPLPVENALVTTDHKGYVYKHDNADPTHARNLTMQSSETLPMRGHYPNGFNAPETKEGYELRIIRLANETADYLLENPGAKVHFQEFMITAPTRALFMSVLKSHGITHQLYATRTFSVATLLPKNSPFHLAKEIMKEINADPQLIGRFLVFHTSGSCYEINGHLPFRGTEKAFKKIYHIIFKHVANHLDDGLETVSMTAYFDTNLAPKIQKKLHKEAYEDFVATRAPNDQPIKGKSLLFVSEACHLQNEGNNKKVLVSVDSCNETIFQKSQCYGYEQKTASEPRIRFGYYASMIIGGGVVVANTIGDFAGEIAAESAFEIIAQETGVSVSTMLHAGFFATISNATKKSFSEEPMLALNEDCFGRKPS